MNKQLTEEAAYILYRKVQVAVAIFVIKNRPNDGENITDYAVKFQNEYRRKTERCSIRLERKILIQQLLHLVPEVSHILQQKEVFPIPMEIDTEGLINADYVNFSLQLSVATELLQALVEVRVLLNERNKIQSADVLRILSKFEDLNPKKLNFYGPQPITEISMHIFKQAMRKIDIEKVAKICVSLIVELFKYYLNILPQEASLSRNEALLWMKKANYLLMKCMNGFAYDGQYQVTIINLLQQSIRYIFIENQTRIIWHQEDEYCKMIMKWKHHRLLCINALNEFITGLNKISQEITKLNETKYIDILKVIKLFLDVFCRKHFKKDGSLSTKEDSGFEALSIPAENISISDRRLLIVWAKGLSNFVGKVENNNFPSLSQLVSRCFNILLSTGELDKVIEMQKCKNRKSGNYLTDSSLQE